MQVGQAADDGLVEFLVVFDAEARVFLGEPPERRAEFLFLALVRRLDREAEHRQRKIDWFQADLVLVVRIVQDRVEMDLLDLRNRGDIAGDCLFDLEVFLALELEQMADLECLFAVVDEQLGVLAHGALVDAEDRQLADERVIDDLEYIRDHVLLRIRFGKQGFRTRAAAFGERGRIAFARVGQEPGGESEQFLHTGATAR